MLWLAAVEAAVPTRPTAEEPIPAAGGARLGVLELLQLRVDDGRAISDSAAEAANVAAVAISEARLLESVE
jgi:hypothetical protein